MVFRGGAFKWEPSVVLIEGTVSRENGVADVDAFEDGRWSAEDTELSDTNGGTRVWLRVGHCNGLEFAELTNAPTLSFDSRTRICDRRPQAVASSGWPVSSGNAHAYLQIWTRVGMGRMFAGQDAVRGVFFRLLRKLIFLVQRPGIC
jgi:hypothetical protein